MRALVRLLSGTLWYAVWPAAAAWWGFDRTERLFREKLVPLPFELFGTVVAAGFFCFALSAALLAVGFWKSNRKGKTHGSKSASFGIPDTRPVDARVGG